ncbi:Rz1-like lysis system protein LysC [Rodentibacter pneumotropicus]|uniref:Rz1-like lysis system protein LysC n=1 Tax=Rodentibacter pneumotropicus TaxID=758 RepID=UPI000525E3FA|nr:Rz1-like lysis system protein LysC [Rodentibacter pneumotropicus]
MLPACSTTAPPTKVRLICPQTTECRPLKVNIQTNGDLADGLNQALDRLEVCTTAYTAVNKCITDFNNQSKNQKEN